MKLPMIIAVATALPLAFGTTVSDAAMMRGDTLKKQVSGSTIRGDFRSLKGYEQHVWEFAPGGTVQADYRVSTTPGKGTGTPKSLTDNGTWWVQNGETLCVDFKVIFRGAASCFNVDVTGDQISLTGAVEMTGTIKKGM